MDSEVVKLFDGYFLFVLTLKLLFIAPAWFLAVAHEHEQLKKSCAELYLP